MLVIFAPYGRNEITAAAIRLADVALASGIDVKLVSLGVHESCVHGFWDQRVRSALDGGIYRAARYAKHCVWFTCSSTHLDMVRLVAGKATHTLVPSWHSLKASDTRLILGFDAIVSPSKLCHDLIKRHVHGGKVPDSKILSWARFDSGLPHTVKNGCAREEQTRLLFHCDSFSIDECPLIALNTMLRLLEWRDDIAITALCTKTWSKRDRARLRDITLAYGERFVVLYQRDFMEQLDIFQQHDWLVLPGVRADFGLIAARGLSCGLPVICYDVSPFSEIIRDGYNGALVQCELGAGWMQAPIAAANSVEFLTRCQDVLTDHDTLLSIQSNGWQVTEPKLEFNRLWLTLWGL